MDQNNRLDYQIASEQRMRGTYSEFSRKAAAKFHISESAIEESAKQFEQERAALKKALQKHLSVIRNAPLLTAFLIWAKTAPYYCTEKTDYQKLLFDSELISFYTDDDKPLIVSDLDSWFFWGIIENIRCDDRFDIHTKERLVDDINEFVHWLRDEAYLTEFDFQDLDRVIASHRTIPYSSYILLISYLEGKYQLIAKLMYFSGKPLSHILTISVQDIEFSRNFIHFGNTGSTFPKHVIKDLKALINDKTVGKVFSGRETKELNPSTVFRNFKNAAARARLGDNFTPKDLYKSKEN